jgi:hypothetical protein
MYSYLCSPYSSGTYKHDDRKLMKEERYREALAAIAWLINNDKYYPFSPIVHCHELAKRYNLPDDATFWRGYNRALLREAQVIYILTISGWQDSEGIEGEITHARYLNKHLYLLNKTPNGYQIVDYTTPQ